VNEQRSLRADAAGRPTGTVAFGGEGQRIKGGATMATMKHKTNWRAVGRNFFFGFLVFAAGYLAGYNVKRELAPLPPFIKAGDDAFNLSFSEEAGHGRVFVFQDALEKMDAKDLKDLNGKLDAQLKIEDLIIKSREAEYAKYTPFTALFTGGVGALLGFFTGLVKRKPNGSAAP
jgi:hypothetical protein